MRPWRAVLLRLAAMETASPSMVWKWYWRRTSSPAMELFTSLTKCSCLTQVSVPPLIIMQVLSNLHLYTCNCTQTSSNHLKCKLKSNLSVTCTNILITWKIDGFKQKLQCFKLFNTSRLRLPLLILKEKLRYYSNKNRKTKTKPQTKNRQYNRSINTILWILSITKYRAIT